MWSSVNLILLPIFLFLSELYILFLFSFNVIRCYRCGITTVLSQMGPAGLLESTHSTLSVWSLETREFLACEVPR